MRVTVTYDLRVKRIGHPVRSAIQDIQLNQVCGQAQKNRASKVMICHSVRYVYRRRPQGAIFRYLFALTSSIINAW